MNYTSWRVRRRRRHRRRRRRRRCYTRTQHLGPPYRVQRLNKNNALRYARFQLLSFHRRRLRVLCSDNVCTPSYIAWTLPVGRTRDTAPAPLYHTRLVSTLSTICMPKQHAAIIETARRSSVASPLRPEPTTRFIRRIPGLFVDINFHDIDIDLMCTILIMFRVRYCRRTRPPVRSTHIRTRIPISVRAFFLLSCAPRRISVTVLFVTIYSVQL